MLALESCLEIVVQFLVLLSLVVVSIFEIHHWKGLKMGDSRQQTRGIVEADYVNRLHDSLAWSIGILESEKLLININKVSDVSLEVDPKSSQAYRCFFSASHIMIW